MEQKSSAQLSQEAQLAIRDARQALADAQRFREERGVPAENARAYLEGQLNEQQLAEVHAAFQADMDEVRLNVEHGGAPTRSASRATAARRNRQIV